MGAETSKPSSEKSVQLTVAPKQHALTRTQQNLLRSLTPDQRSKVKQAVKVIGTELAQVAAEIKKDAKAKKAAAPKPKKAAKKFPTRGKAKAKACAEWEANKKADPIKPVNPISKRHVHAAKRTAKTIDKTCKPKK